MSQVSVAMRDGYRLALLTTLILSVGCSGGGGGGSGAGAPLGGSPAGTAVLTGTAALTGSNQLAAARLVRAAAAAETGTLTVVVETPDGTVRREVSTASGGGFTVDGLPAGKVLRVTVKTGGAALVSFVEIPKDTEKAEGVRVDPLATLIAHRVLKVFRDRKVQIGELGSVNPAALVAQIRAALDGLGGEFAFRLIVELSRLRDDPDANAATFEELVPDSLLDACGNAIELAEADADIEVGNPAGLKVAVARRILHTRAALLFSMQPGVTDTALIEFVKSLRPELRFDPRADGTPWSGAGPCLIKVPFEEPDRNHVDEDRPRPFIEGPLFDDAQVTALTELMKNGRTYTLADLHRIFFSADGAGFVMVGLGRFGDNPAPYVLSGEGKARLVPPPLPGQPPDWRAAGAIEPPIKHTFGTFLGPVPSLEQLRHRFFDKRIHVPGNPTGGPREFVAALSDLFWSTRGASADPIRVRLDLARDATGKIAGATVVEAADGAFFLGLTERTHAPEGAFRFLDATTLRPLRLEDGRPLLGVRTGFADPARGAVDLAGLHERHTINEQSVHCGPPLVINGKPFPIVYDRPFDGKPVEVQGPTLTATRGWDVSPRFELASSDRPGPRFFLAFTDTVFPFRADASKVLLIDTHSGEPLAEAPNGPIAVLLARIETELARPLHASTRRIPSCAVPNPRYDPQFDPFFDDLNASGAADPGEPSFPFRPFIPPHIEAGFGAAAGQPGYLAGPAAYQVDPVIYSLPDGRPFSLGEPPPGFRFDRSPKDNGLRLRRFHPRLNGFLHGRPHSVFVQLLSAFPPAFFDGKHSIAADTRLDILQCLALARIRLATPEVVADVTLDVDPGAGEVLKPFPFLEFQFQPGDPRSVMPKLLGGFTR